MSARTSRPIASDVFEYLDAQIGSARRLLAHILRQSDAISRRDIDAVLAAMTDIQRERASRSRLERERTDLMRRAGSMLNLPPEIVPLNELMSDAESDEARARSTELRELLAEVEREHAINRSLMRQELSFLEHLTRMLDMPAADSEHSPDAARQADASGSFEVYVADMDA
ncbi:MAG TPA: flagellar export chaperone FlgN [Solirubrobacteraceae bacterium]